jgi:hypothetical protein
VFDPDSAAPFPLGRGSLEGFFRCQRCFYLERRCGVTRPDSLPLTLNLAVDALLKREFDIYRGSQTVPPILRRERLDCVPYAHPDFEEWRNNFRGVKRLHLETNLLLYGAIDDLWFNRGTGLVHVVDYKATSKQGRVSLDADWQIAYKRQVEVYRWLLSGQGLPMSDIAYFVYCNARKDGAAFRGRLDFSVSIIAYQGDDSWVEPTLREAKDCLMRDPRNLPDADSKCGMCRYRAAVRRFEP